MSVRHAHAVLARTRYAELANLWQEADAELATLAEVHAGAK